MLGIAESVIGVAGKVLDKFVEDKDLKIKLYYSWLIIYLKSFQSNCLIILIHDIKEKIDR